MFDLEMLIGGELVSGPTSFDVLNPATASVFATAPKASERELNAAVSSAKKAFPGWSTTSFEDRQAKLAKLADGLEAATNELATVIVAEAGKPIHEATMEVYVACLILRHVASLGHPQVEEISTSSGQLVKIYRKPLGVVAGITPWNMPLMQPVLKLAMALVAGNTLVLKPAPSTPLSALMLGRQAAEIFPAGVVNVIIDQNDLGPMLTAHPDVAKIGFTGSTITGRKIMASAAPGLKRLTMELGGSDAAIILPDVDVERVARTLFATATFNCGQICTAPKRIYAHRDISDALAEAMAKRANEAVVGDGATPGTTLGPLQNSAQYNKVLSYMSEAQEKGTVVSGGRRLEQDGYFVEPMIVKDVSEGMRLVDEEQFGPIIPVLSFTDEADAIMRANASPYGLGGSIWSADVERAAALASQLDVGQAWVNSHGVSPIEAPLSGAKQSGFGVEGGPDALHAYTQITAVTL